MEKMPYSETDLITVYKYREQIQGTKRFFNLMENMNQWLEAEAGLIQIRN